MTWRPMVLAVLLSLGAINTALGDDPPRQPTQSIPEPVRALLSRTADKDTVVAQRTLQEALKEAEARNDRLAQLHVAEATQLLGLSRHQRGDREAAEVFFKTALALWERLAPKTRSHASGLGLAAEVAHERGDLDSARSLNEQALQIWDVLEPMSRSTAAVCNNLGLIAMTQNRPSAARQYHERALAIWEKLAPDSLAVSHSLTNLAVLADRRGELSCSVALHERALALREKLVPDSAFVGHSLINLGASAKRIGTLTKARQHLLRAQTILRKAAPHSRELAISLLLLGGIELEEGRIEAAKEHQHEALHIFDQLLPGSTEVAETLIDLGNAAAVEADYPSALRYLERAKKITDNLPPDSATVANLWTSLGNLCQARGELLAADAHYSKSLAIHTQTAPDSAEVAGARLNLGLIALDRGDLTKASEHLSKAHALFSGLDPDSVPAAKADLGLGTVQVYRGDLNKAEEHYKRALAAFSRFSPDSPNELGALINLGNLALDKGRFHESKNYYEQVLKAQNRVSPPPMDLAITLNNLGNIASQQGMLEEARDYYTRALDTLRRVAPHALVTAAALGNVATLDDEIGEVNSAKARYTQAISIYDANAPGSPDLDGPLRGLTRLLLAAGEVQEARRCLERLERLESQINRVQSDGASTGTQASRLRLNRPQVLFASPALSSIVRGNEVEIRFAVFSASPVSNYRVWVNGRPLGGERGFSIPSFDEQGRPYDKGRLLEKDAVIEKGRLLEKGQVLQTEREREAVAAQLPEALAAVARLPQSAYFVQIRHTLPVEDMDGQHLRIAIQVRSADGPTSDRALLYLRRPEAEQFRGSLKVLSVGISAYQNLPKLQYAANDATVLGQALRDQAGMMDDHRLYRGSVITSLTDADATLARIREELDRLVETTRPGDTVLVALSGHGVTKGSDTWFAPVRFDPENPQGTGLAWSELLARLEAVRKVARTVWLLADCCRAAPGLRRREGNPAMPQVVGATPRELKRGVDEGGNLLVVTASSGDAPSYERDDVKHGLFTYSWLQALRGEAPDLLYEPTARGKVLTLSGLQFWLDMSLKQQSDRLGVRQRLEFPRLEGSFSPSTPLFVPTSPR